MFDAPHPDLNEEERALLRDAPEACLRSAVERGVLSLDHITEDLTPRAAAVVRNVVKEERSGATGADGRALNAQERERDILPSLGAALRSLVAGERVSESPEEDRLSRPERGSADHVEHQQPSDVARQTVYKSLGAWPGLQHAVDEGNLTASEALAVAQTIDGALGRYMTGTRYAAP
jgi:hypothetical protein